MAASRKPTLDDVIRAAPKLREVGVVRLRLGDLEIDLARESAPMVPMVPLEEFAEPDDMSGDPLRDPATFNRTNGVPSYRRGDT